MNKHISLLSDSPYPQKNMLPSSLSKKIPTKNKTCSQAASTNATRKRQSFYVHISHLPMNIIVSERTNRLFKQSLVKKKPPKTTGKIVNYNIFLVLFPYINILVDEAQRKFRFFNLMVRCILQN